MNEAVLQNLVWRLRAEISRWILDSGPYLVGNSGEPLPFVEYTATGKDKRRYLGNAVPDWGVIRGLDQGWLYEGAGEYLYVEPKNGQQLSTAWDHFREEVHKRILAAVHGHYGVYPLEMLAANKDVISQGYAITIYDHAVQLVGEEKAADLLQSTLLVEWWPWHRIDPHRMLEYLVSSGQLDIASDSEKNMYLGLLRTLVSFLVAGTRANLPCRPKGRHESWSIGATDPVEILEWIKAQNQPVSKDRGRYAAFRIRPTNDKPARRQIICNTTIWLDGLFYLADKGWSPAQMQEIAHQEMTGHDYELQAIDPGAPLWKQPHQNQREFLAFEQAMEEIEEALQGEDDSYEIFNVLEVNSLLPATMHVTRSKEDEKDVRPPTQGMLEAQLAALARAHKAVSRFLSLVDLNESEDYVKIIKDVGDDIEQEIKEINEALGAKPIQVMSAQIQILSNGSVYIDLESGDPTQRLVSQAVYPADLNEQEAHLLATRLKQRILYDLYPLFKKKPGGARPRRAKPGTPAETPPRTKRSYTKLTPEQKRKFGPLYERLQGQYPEAKPVDIRKKVARLLGIPETYGGTSDKSGALRRLGRTSKGIKEVGQVTKSKSNLTE